MGQWLFIWSDFHKPDHANYLYLYARTTLYVLFLLLTGFTWLIQSPESPVVSYTTISPLSL